MQIFVVPFQKAVGIISRMIKIRLKLTTTALDESKLKNSLRVFIELFFDNARSVYPFYAREVFLHGNQDNVDNPPNSTTAGSYEF